MLLTLQTNINKLNKEYSELERYEIEIKLIQFEEVIVRILNAKKFLVRPPVEELKVEIKDIKDKIYDLGKEDLAELMHGIKDKIDDIIDIQMMAELGGAGVYRSNVKKAAKKKNNGK
jgi:uncharacterized protein YlzI (FlbEa/FlbD family)